jgi:hypothetical protein
MKLLNKLFGTELVLRQGNEIDVFQRIKKHATEKNFGSSRIVAQGFKRGPLCPVLGGEAGYPDFYITAVGK